MSTWRVLELGAVGVAACLGGAAAAVAAAWALTRLARSLAVDPHISSLIAQKGAATRFTGQDDALRARADRRRQRADVILRAGHRIRTKDDSPLDFLRRAK